MLTQVDHRDGFVVFKVTNGKGQKLCYRAFPEDKIGDATARKEFPTLVDARNLLSPLPNKGNETKSKLQCPHNQPGYRADNRR